MPFEREETIEIREGDYVVAGHVATATAPAPSAARQAAARFALIAFALGFVATAAVGIVATLI